MYQLSCQNDYNQNIVGWLVGYILWQVVGYLMPNPV